MHLSDGTRTRGPPRAMSSVDPYTWTTWTYLFGRHRTHGPHGPTSQMDPIRVERRDPAHLSGGPGYDMFNPTPLFARRGSHLEMLEAMSSHLNG